jgi:hypothetical protein
LTNWRAIDCPSASAIVGAGTAWSRMTTILWGSAIRFGMGAVAANVKSI